VSAILVTGAGGFIGSNLARRLRAQHEVVCLSRKPTDAGARSIAGAFHSFEDLRALDGIAIETAIHLAAETGGATEENALAVNVQGTRRLMRYLLDRGCRRFILASSICAAGALTAEGAPFVPRSLPIPADHPFEGRDPYGLSKWLMEGVARYFSRCCRDADIVSLRFGAVIDERTADLKHVPAPQLGSWGFVRMGKVALDDVVRGIEAVLSHPRPGYRQYNLVGPDNSSDEPVPQLIRAWLGEAAAGLDTAGLDLSHYERPGRAFDSLYSMAEMERDLGFVSRIPVRPSAFAKWKEPLR
jgi:UDP-glucose 4-epimerase